MTFKKYMHIERHGNEEVLGIELGEVYVFPKLDGTNASLWLEEKYEHDNSWTEICGGSRNRQVSLENDNQGFFSWIHESEPLEKFDKFFAAYPHLRLYGEWLVPHTLKTYREDAWHKFYVFDVYNDDSEQFLRYEDYQPLMDAFGIDYIPPLAIVKNGSYENFIHVLKQNNFYIKDGEGLGEGIVLKNYNFYNKFGNQVWAKIVSSEFKEQHHRVMGAPEVDSKLVEEEIVEEFVTEALVTKVQSKIQNERDGWSSKYIPQLLETVYYDLIREEMWQILKKHKNPTVNFKTLKHFTIGKVKSVMPELF